VSATEELLERKSSGSCLEIREYGRRDQSLRSSDTLHPQTLSVTSPTSGGRSASIVRSRTQATEFRLVRSCPCFRYAFQPTDSISSRTGAILSCVSLYLQFAVINGIQCSVQWRPKRILVSRSRSNSPCVLYAYSCCARYNGQCPNIISFYTNNEECDI
jgi:hypothetical protein